MNPPENRKFLTPIPVATGMGGCGEIRAGGLDQIVVENPVSPHEDEFVRANEIRYLAQRNALITLTKETQRDQMELAEAFLRITETTARTLGVGRVSIWRHNEERSKIECLDLFQLTTASHSSGMELVASEYPAYFQGLETMELIAADNAVLDPHTFEFTEGYLGPLGIGSMMDVPVRLADRVDYLLCCEHVGRPRRWTSAV